MTTEHNSIPALVGGHCVLDLVNTVEPRAEVADRLERLTDPAELLRWAARAEVVDAGEVAATEAAWAAGDGGVAALTAVIEIREAAFAALSGPDAAALAVLDRRRREAAARSQLVGAGGRARLAVGTEPALMIVDRLAAAAVQLLCAEDLSRLRACPVADGGCGWLFFDRSKNGSRRWCAMNDCGKAAKVRRLTEKRRAARAR
jgi:predicted RNA-binding Zn ribbon-like protein